MTIATTTFDYSAIDTDAKSKLIWFANQIQKEGAKHVSSGLEIGRMLSEARALLGADQSFQSWIERECGYSSRTAYRYIAAFDHFGDCDTVSHIELSAMYELTKSDSAKKKALKLAEKGVRVTQAMAKQLVSDAAPKETKRPAVPLPPPVEPAEPIDDEPTEADAQEHDDFWPKGDSPDEPASQAKPDPEPVDYGKCPNCASTKWTEDEFGLACAKCHHPHGEPTGGADEDRVATQRSKTVKTCEALMRAFDDLNTLVARPEHGETIRSCKALLTTARAWK